MVSKAVTSFLCICAWLHGATVGIAVGDSVEIYRFFALTCGTVLTIVAIWHHSTACRRVAASLTFLVCSAFLISIVKSITWFRTPQLLTTTLPDVGHDLLATSILQHSSLSRLPNIVMLALLVMTVVFVACHPLRLTITRRVLMIYATLLLVRAIVSLVTYLPDSNPRCHGRHVTMGFTDLSVKEVVRRMVLSLVPALVEEFTDSVTGTPRCRDIILCGHTVMLIICALTWHTYYKWVPAMVNHVKASIWLCVVAIMILRLAQQLNYSIDIILAAYFTITTWATYHRLANDVITGHSFTAVWLIDKVVVYPIIEWMEASVTQQDKVNLNQTMNNIFSSSPRHNMPKTKKGFEFKSEPVST